MYTEFLLLGQKDWDPSSVNKVKNISFNMALGIWAKIVTCFLQIYKFPTVEPDEKKIISHEEV